MRKSILKRALLNNWFESHLWLVKRFRMKRKFGYLVPFKRRDKSFKACYRYFKFDAVVNDCSYFNFAFIRNRADITDQENPQKNTSEFLKIINLLIKKISFKKNIFSDENNQSLYNKCFELDVYNFKNGNFIGPCLMILTEEMLIIKFNPLIANEIIQNIFYFKFELENENYNSDNLGGKTGSNLEIYYSKNLNSYKLLGPRVGSRLYKILASLSAFENLLTTSHNNILSEMQGIFENENSFERFLDDLPIGECLYFKIKKPSKHFKMNEYNFNSFYEKFISLKEKEKLTLADNKMEVEDNQEILKSVNQINRFSYKEELTELLNFLINEECINLTEIFNQDLWENEIKGEKIQDCGLKSNIEKLANILKKEKNKNINNLQKKHLLRKFESIENSYNERGPLVHKRKMKIDHLNDKIEESLHIDKKNILDYFSLQLKSDKNLGTKKLDRIVNNTITENINNYDLADINKLLHSNEDSYIIILKTCIINNNNFTDNQIFKSTPVYELIFPSGYSSDLLRRFHYIETKVIGLKELNYFLTENNSQIFPDDYPNTTAYREYIIDKTIKKIEKYCSYPPSKRTNYQKFVNPFPFYAAWDSLKEKKFNNYVNENDFYKGYNFNKFNNDVVIIDNIKNKFLIEQQLGMQLIKKPSDLNLLVPIKFEMIAKGKPVYNSLICLPKHSDIECLYDYLYVEKKNEKCDFTKPFVINLLNNPLSKEKLLKLNSDKNSKNNIIQTTVETHFKNLEFNSEYKIYKDLYDTNNLNKTKYSSNILDYNFNIQVDINKLERNIIGFVTSGQYSFSLHKGIGKGCIRLANFDEILKMKNEYRNKMLSKTNKNVSELDIINAVLIRNPDSNRYYFAKFNF